MSMSTKYLVGHGPKPEKQWHGIYDAVVINNNDPLGEDRVRMQVPQVLGAVYSNWAYPMSSSAPGAPAVGTFVFASFRGGSINDPVYSPKRWSTLSAPAAADTAAPGNWALITSTGGWSTVSGLVKPQARLTVGSQSLEIIGNLSGGTTTDGTSVGSLPSGMYNTSAAAYIPVAAVTGASSVANAVDGGNSYTNYNTPCLKVGTDGTLKLYNLNSHVTQISFHEPSLPITTL